MSRYLLCRPCGGFNDMMCRISAGLGYAQRSNRTIIIDTEFSKRWSENCFQQPFGSVFELKNPLNNILLRLTPALLSELQQLPTYPPALAGKLHEPTPTDKWVVKKLADCICHVNLVSDDIPLVVYQQCGGGNIAVNALQYFRFHPLVAATIRKRLRRLPTEYQAIHIRNTDRKTNYLPFFQTIKPQMKGQNLLICSDDARCIDDGRELFDESNVITLSNIPRISKPLHHIGKDDENYDKHTMNVDMLTDLMGLAGSSKIHTQSSQHLSTINISGYAYLAQSLQQQPRLRKQLLHG